MSHRSRSKTMLMAGLATLAAAVGVAVAEAPAHAASQATCDYSLALNSSGARQQFQYCHDFTRTGGPFTFRVSSSFVLATDSDYAQFGGPVGGGPAIVAPEGSQNYASHTPPWAASTIRAYTCTAITYHYGATYGTGTATGYGCRATG